MVTIFIIQFGGGCSRPGTYKPTLTLQYIINVTLYANYTEPNLATISTPTLVLSPITTQEGLQARAQVRFTLKFLASAPASTMYQIRFT